MTKRFVSACCDGERCFLCHEDAEHKIEEVIFHDDPLPHRHPLTSYICHRHFVDVMGPAADAQSKVLSQMERIEHMARDLAHELFNRDCFGTKPHSEECEEAYQRIRTTLLCYAKGIVEP